MIPAAVCVGKLSVLQPNKQFQLVSTVRSAQCVKDDLGMTHPLGELQKYDLQIAGSVHAHRYFLMHTFKNNQELWAKESMIVIQIHQPVKDGLRIHGTFITDGAMNLVKYCVENEPALLARKNKEIVLAAIRRLCTPLSVAIRL